MIYGFYFRFYKLTQCKWLSTVLARLVYSGYLLLFTIKRCFAKKRAVSMTGDEARAILTEMHPDPQRTIEYRNKPIDESVDLSIIVPIYNYAHLIRANIDSILAQKTKYTYELILVDDGSTDGAKDIVKEYETHPRVKAIFQQNQGIAGARNTGINEATGKYLMFVDCDDIVHDNIVEILLDKAYQASSDIVMCAHNLSKEKNGEIYQVIPNIYPDKNLLNYCKDAVIFNYAGLPWCKVYKRELFDNVRFFPGYWYEDTIMHMLVFTQCKRFDYVPTIAYEYKWYESNFSHTQGDSKRIKTIDRYWLLKAILAHYDEMGGSVDARFYTTLVNHLCSNYYGSIAQLPEQALDAMFVLAREILLAYQPQQKVKLPYALRMGEKALRDNDIALWKLASKYQ